MNSLPQVRAGLLRHQLDGQVLIYDTREDSVHLLDTTTGHVFELLEQGDRSREGIVAELGKRMNSIEGESLLRLSLDELRKADLLVDAQAPTEALTDISRRDLVRKLGLAGVAALLIPTITTLTATRAYAQASCLPSGHDCDPFGIACCAGLTCNGDPGTCVST